MVAAAARDKAALHTDSTTAGSAGGIGAKAVMVVLDEALLELELDDVEADRCTV